MPTATPPPSTASTRRSSTRHGRPASGRPTTSSSRHRISRDGAVESPAYVTMLHNGVLVHDHRPLIGAMAYRAVGKYQPHGPKGPILLQDHGNPVRFRNIWVRELKDPDQPSSPSAETPKSRPARIHPGTRSRSPPADASSTIVRERVSAAVRRNMHFLFNLRTVSGYHLLTTTSSLRRRPTTPSMYARRPFLDKAFQSLDACNASSVALAHGRTLATASIVLLLDASRWASRGRKTLRWSGLKTRSSRS